MSSLPKDAESLHLFSNTKNHNNKYKNRPRTKLGRVKSMDEKSPIPIETNLI